MSKMNAPIIKIKIREYIAEILNIGRIIGIRIARYSKKFLLLVFAVGYCFDPQCGHVIPISMTNPAFNVSFQVHC